LDSGCATALLGLETDFGSIFLVVTGAFNGADAGFALDLGNNLVVDAASDFAVAVVVDDFNFFSVFETAWFGTVTFPLPTDLPTVAADPDLVAGDEFGAGLADELANLLVFTDGLAADLVAVALPFFSEDVRVFAGFFIALAM
jgi:hypothetical protein